MASGIEGSHQEAQTSDAWKCAMQEEWDALVDDNTWTFTPLPKGRRTIKCKWVYKTKCDAAGNPHRYNARLVVKSYSQRTGGGLRKNVRSRCAIQSSSKFEDNRDMMGIN